MNQKISELEINGITFIPKTESYQKTETFEGMEYKIIRTYSAGVFAGYLEKKWIEGGLCCAIVRNARRIWSWSGASSLSELAVKGTADPSNCKFPCTVDKVELIRVIEILDVTKQAKKSIDEVKIWTQH